MLLQQKSEQMGNDLDEQQMSHNNNAKAKQQTQQQLSSSLSQVLKTYDFGISENCKLNIDITLMYLHLHPLMYHMCRNLHRRASPFL